LGGKNVGTPLQDIEERLTKLPPEERYAGAYGILRGFFETILDTCTEAYTFEQLNEMRIILGSLDIATGEKNQRIAD